MYQQGDVVLVKITDIVDLPEGLKSHDNVLAEGEATGHHHVAEGEGVAVLEKEGEPGDLFLLAPNGATIGHEEHNPLTVPPGTYEVKHVREYDHFEEEARRVAD